MENTKESAQIVKNVGYFTLLKKFVEDFQGCKRNKRISKMQFINYDDENYLHIKSTYETTQIVDEMLG